MKHLIALFLALTACGTSLNDVVPDTMMCYAPFLSPSERMAKQISDRYTVDEKFATDVVKLAMKYQSKTFPRASDIVAIIGVESSFKPSSRSKLAKDQAVGLTQIRPAAWRHKIQPGELDTIDGQVKYGAFILAHYYEVLGDKTGAVKSYNVGLNGYTQGKRQAASARYAAKYVAELATYKTGAI